MKKTMFEQIKVKEYQYWAWIFLLILSTLFMIYTILFCKIDENIPLTNLQKIFPPLILATCIYLWQHGRYYFLIYRKYNSTVFHIYPKRIRPEKPLRIVELITFKNRIIYRYQDEPTYEGEIVLDLINLKYGKGFHNNNPFPIVDNMNENMDTSKTDNIQNDNYAKSDQFGFDQFIVTNDKIFVEHPYIKPDENKPPYGDIRYQVSIWIRESVETEN